MSESLTWERRENEANRWFRRFELFRLMGSGRSMLQIYLAEWRKRREVAGKSASREPKTLPASWRENAKTWEWRERADAWDRHLIAEREAAIKATQEAAE